MKLMRARELKIIYRKWLRRGLNPSEAYKRVADMVKQLKANKEELKKEDKHDKMLDKLYGGK